MPDNLQELQAARMRYHELIDEEPGQIPWHTELMHNYKPYPPTAEKLRQPRERMEAFQETYNRYTEKQKARIAKYTAKRGSIAAELGRNVPSSAVLAPREEAAPANVNGPSQSSGPGGPGIEMPPNISAQGSQTDAERQAQWDHWKKQAKGPRKKVSEAQDSRAPPATAVSPVLETAGAPHSPPYFTGPGGPGLEPLPSPRNLP